MLPAGAVQAQASMLVLVLLGSPALGAVATLRLRPRGTRRVNPLYPRGTPVEGAPGAL